MKQHAYVKDAFSMDIFVIYVQQVTGQDRNKFDFVDAA